MKSKKPIILFAAITLVLLAGIAVYQIWFSAPPMIEVTPVDLACKFTEGEAFVYRFEAVAESRFDRTALMSKVDPNNMEVDIKPALVKFLANLNLEIVSVKDRKAKIAALFTDIKWEHEQKPLPEDRRREITAPFTFEIAEDCRIRNIELDPTISTQSAAQIKNTLKTAEIALKPGKLKTEWMAIQEDETGTFQAQYKIISGGETPLIGKKKERYIEVYSATGGSIVNITPQNKKITSDILESFAEFTLPADRSWVSEMRGVEHIQLKSEFGIFADARGEFVFKRKKSGKDAHNEVLRKWIKSGFNRLPHRLLNSSAPPQHLKSAKKRPDDWAKPYLEMTITEAVDDFSALLLRKDTDPTAYTTAVQQLTDFLKVHPEKAYELIDMIKDGRIAEDFQAPAFLALEQAATPESLDALMKAINDEGLSAMNRMRAIVALKDTPNLSPEAINLLFDVSRSATSGDELFAHEIASTATLALGSVSNRYDGVDTEITDKIYQEMQTRVENLAEPGDKVVTLEAIGNAGDERLIDGVVAVYQQSAEPPIRIHAAKSLESMADEKAENILGDWMVEDEDPMVRTIAAQVIGDRAQSGFDLPSDETIGRAVERLPVEDDINARAQLIRVLGPMAQKSKLAKAALIDHFNREKTAAILVLIGKYLPAEDLR